MVARRLPVEGEGGASREGEALPRWRGPWNRRLSALKWPHRLAGSSEEERPLNQHRVAPAPSSLCYSTSPNDSNCKACLGACYEDGRPDEVPHLGNSQISAPQPKRVNQRCVAFHSRWGGLFYSLRGSQADLTAPPPLSSFQQLTPLVGGHTVVSIEERGRLCGRHGRREGGDGGWGRVGGRGGRERWGPGCAGMSAAPDGCKAAPQEATLPSPAQGIGCADHWPGLCPPRHCHSAKR